MHSDCNTIDDLSWKVLVRIAMRACTLQNIESKYSFLYLSSEHCKLLLPLSFYSVLSGTSCSFENGHQLFLSLALDFAWKRGNLLIQHVLISKLSRTIYFNRNGLKIPPQRGFRLWNQFHSLMMYKLCWIWYTMSHSFTGCPWALQSAKYHS